jgi:peptidoglycan/xylan/chitin deacetylase (PgdA/CDA1 family)
MAIVSMRHGSAAVSIHRRTRASGTRVSAGRTVVLVVAVSLILGGMSSARASTAAVGLRADIDGRVSAFGGAPTAGDLAGVHLHMPIVAVVDRPGGAGYWMAALDGGVFSFGGAPFFGSMGAVTLNQPVVGMAPTPTGRGYWLVAADGGVFSFGDARFCGSMGAVKLNQPVAAMTASRTGRGYWLVAADGGVFSFGDARFFGSRGGISSGSRTSTIAMTRTGLGYWLLDRDGGVHPFGDARSFGEARVANSLSVGIVPSPSGAGYWIATADGVVRSFGDAGPVGPLAQPGASVVGLATPWGSSSGIALPLLEFLRAYAAHPPEAPTRFWVNAHEIALTFDDGPSSYTAQVLLVLAQYHVRATFFVVGEQVDAHRDSVRAEIAAGMAVGDHTWDHADLTRLSSTSIDSELGRGADAIAAVTGRRPVCFRPPYGATDATVVHEGNRLGLAQILWNVDPSDYLRPGASTIAARVLGAATGRGLVVGIHDGGGDRSQTVAALPYIINGMRAHGYTFVRLC